MIVASAIGGYAIHGCAAAQALIEASAKIRKSARDVIMKLPNWFKIIWWLLLTGGLTWILYNRYPDLIAGHAAPVDVFFFAVWVALMLVPLFTEVSFLGIKFKQEVEELKAFVETKIGDIRSDIRNAVDIRTTFNPQIMFPTPVSDAYLPELEAKIKTAIAEALSIHGAGAMSAEPSAIEAPEDVTYLFTTRFVIERELRRIANGRGLTAQDNRPVPIFRLGRELVLAEVLEPRLEKAIRDVYAVCSPAIHGQSVTAAQIDFVKDVGPGLIAALQSIK